MADPVEQYLRRYAEPEARDLPEGAWDHAVVVPLHREAPSFLDALAPLTTLGRTVVIAVVNARQDDPPATHATHAALSTALREASRPNLDVVVVDRATPGRFLPTGQGVGLARKIGLDMALGLWRTGAVTSPWLRTTDADASFEVVGEARSWPSDVVAEVAPYWHTPCGEPLRDRAAALHEVWLRYYVAGLAWAGSPWAYPTIGSTLTVHARAYAAVRGVPRREAGEDFHLLAKLAKLGVVAHGGPVRVALRTRLSDRVPFGTGPSTRRFEQGLAAGKAPTMHDPIVFDRLRQALAVLDAVAQDECALDRRLETSAPSVAAVLIGAGLPGVVARGKTQRVGAITRRRRLHEWFDALETLRFIHRIRDREAPDLPWDDAIARAEFGAEVAPTAAPTAAPTDGLDALRLRLAAVAPARAGLGSLVSEARLCRA